MPRTLQKVFGRWWWVVVVVVYSEFSVLLWSKALVLDLDQAEQNSICVLVDEVNSQHRRILMPIGGWQNSRNVK